MRSLVESILDSDFDVSLTIGDTCFYQPKFGSQECAWTDGVKNRYHWKWETFWRSYGDVQNAWTRYMDRRMKNSIRLKHMKMDARHGLAMWMFCQPIEDLQDGAKLLKQGLKVINQYTDKKLLDLEADYEKYGPFHIFTLWNRAVEDSTQQYMGKFAITESDEKFK